MRRVTGTRALRDTAKVRRPLRGSRRRVALDSRNLTNNKNDVGEAPKRQAQANAPRVNQMGIKEAIAASNYDEIKDWCSRNDVNFSFVDAALPPIHYACTIGNFESVKILHELGARLDTKTADGYYPIDIAYWHGEYRMGAYTEECLKIVAYLKEHGGKQHDPLESGHWKFGPQLSGLARIGIKRWLIAMAILTALFLVLYWTLRM